MLDRQAVQITLLLWGCIFSLIAAVCMFLSKNFDREKRNWMLYMQLSTALLLGGDALAFIFRGYPGTVGYFMVRISNFIVFAMSDVTLLFFHCYICCYLLPGKQKKKLFRVRLVPVLCLAGVIMVILSQFTHFYYYFDDANFYHRNAGYMISILIPALGMFLDFSLLVQYQKNISRKMLVSMTSYITLPLLAAAVQVFYYGVSLINFSIGVSMIFMYVTITGEQNQEMNQLSLLQSRTEEQLEIATTLNECVTELSSDTDIRQAIYNLLRIVNQYFKADRSYIFEIDFEKEIIVNTHEYVKSGISEEKDNLQEVPLDLVAVWLESFEKNQVYYIPDLEKEKGASFYEILQGQGIQRLLAVPLRKDNVILGFLGVDNPQKHYNDATLLLSIQYFITNSLVTKKQQEQLEYLSYRDALTKLYNRNKYVGIVESYDGKQLHNVGAAYIDLNGLKKVNDKQGHEAGDKFIKSAAQILAECFPENAYRVGGDEFVLLLLDVAKQEFDAKIKSVQEKMKENKVSVSVGSLWREEVSNLEELLKEADRLMYEKKEQYYRENKERML